MNFIPNDEEIYDAILFTLGTTNGKFVCSSTPWTTDSVFYHVWNDPAYKDFAKSHVTWKEAWNPTAPSKNRFLPRLGVSWREIHGDGNVRWKQSGQRMKTSGFLKA